MKYQDSQNDSMESGIYIIRLLSREQHNVLVFNIGIERVAEIFHFPDTFGIPHQVDPRKWDISSTHAIQALKPGASCFSHESTLMTSKTASSESIALWVLLQPVIGRARSAKYDRRREMKYQDSQNDSMDSEIYIIRLLLREQHNVLLSKA